MLQAPCLISSLTLRRPLSSAFPVCVAPPPPPLCLCALLDAQAPSSCLLQMARGHMYHPPALASLGAPCSSPDPSIPFTRVRPELSPVVFCPAAPADSSLLLLRRVHADPFYPIFPHPPTPGHEELLVAAGKTLEARGLTAGPLSFELSVRNADKPPLAREVRLPVCFGGWGMWLPPHTGVCVSRWLTAASLSSWMPRRACLLRGCQLLCGPSSSPMPPCLWRRYVLPSFLSSLGPVTCSCSLPCLSFPTLSGIPLPR